MNEAVPASERSDIDALLSGSVFEIAIGLLGCRVRTEVDGAMTEVMLTEVEAYAGADDPASHAYRGRTARNTSMFERAGTVYVYRSYGIHWCMNIVVGEPGVAHAVLLRGGEPTAGRGVMVERRGRTDHLTDGPGKLCQALAVSGADDGTSIVDGPVRLIPGTSSDGAIRRTPRIGISVAKERPWRYVLEAGSRQPTAGSRQPLTTDNR